MEYPKIETLFDRDPQTGKVIIGQFRKPEFAAIDRWIVSEKLDGTNIRISYTPGDTGLTINGRTANAQLPAQLVEWIRNNVFVSVVAKLFDKPVILYGEGIGPGIQKGGENYGDHQFFVLFDVLVDGKWWMEQHDVCDIAAAIGVGNAPMVGHNIHTDTIVRWVRDGVMSARADGSEFLAEGVVCRPMVRLFDNAGKRVIWKLKTKDFEGVKNNG